MVRMITVKGIGRASAKPDYVVLSMSLEAKDLNYENAMELAAAQLEQLRNSLIGIGFEKESVKTTNFNVRTDHAHVKDEYGNYQSVFNGYIVSHALKVEFDFDSRRLADALGTVAACLSNPQLNIAFTVRDATEINEEMLRSATTNAKRKAEILCDASNVTMGQLLSIDYNWSELNIFSRTEYAVAEDCMPMMRRADTLEIEPDDIEVSDTATFVWEIRGGN